MRSVVRWVLLLCVVLLPASAALAAPQTDYQNYGGDGGGGGSCQICRMVQQNNSISLYCGSPDPGDMGQQNCRIESYPEDTYCFVDGNACCVD